MTANVQAGGAAAGVHTGNQGTVAGDYGYSETATDLRAKVLGGSVRVRREWAGGEWTFFPAWRTLEPRVGGDPLADGFVSLVAGERPDALVRGRYTYEHVEGSDPARWAFDEQRRIVATDSGYRWENRAGEWIAYDDRGRMTAYGGRNDVRVSLERNDAGRIARVFDHHGDMALAFDYDGQGHLVRARDRAGREVRYEWDGGRLVAVIDARGKRWTYGYDSLANQLRLTTKTDPDGRTTTLEYAEIGGTTGCVPTGSGGWSTDNSGAIVWGGRCVQKSIPPRAYLKAKSDARGTIERYRYAYDGDADRFVRATEKGGVLTERVLDSEGRVVERRVDGETVEQYRHGANRRVRIDSLGHETRTDLNRYDEPVRRTYPDGTSETWSYNEFGDVTHHVNEVGTVTSHTYDNDGNRIRTIEGRDTPAERIIQYTYDQYGQRTGRKLLSDSRTKAGKRTWTYDRHGNVATMTDAAGYTRTYTDYNSRGEAEAWTDRAGHYWQQTFDAAGNRLSRTDPLGYQRKWEYNRAGHRIARVDKLGNRTEYTFDAAGLLTAVTDLTGATTELGYDAQRRVTKVTDADDVTRLLVYNDAGRLAKTVDPAGIVRRLTYGGDALNAETNQLVGIEEPRRDTEFRYDERGRRTAMIITGADGAQEVTKYRYDAAGHLVAVVEPGGTEISYTYDALGRRVETTGPDGETVIFEYTDRGNVKSVVNQKGVKFRVYNYSVRGNRTKSARPGGGVHYYSYDEKGRRIRYRDAKGQIKKTIYDEAGRRSEVAYYENNDAFLADSPYQRTHFTNDKTGRMTGYNDGNSSATYVYDAEGRRTDVTVDFGPFSKSFNRTYTDAGRLKTLSYPDDDTVTYGYDSAGRVTAITRENGEVLAISYKTATGKMASIHLPGGAKREWTYDGLGRIDRVTALDSAQNSLDSRSFSFDDAGNIAKIDTSDGIHSFSYDDIDRLISASHPEMPDEEFTYDNTGNRLTGGGNSESSQYDADNKLVQTGSINNEYDANGALIRTEAPDGVTNYRYGVRHRLKRIETPDGVIQTHSYDPMGHRIRKTVNGEATYTLYSGDRMLAVFSEDGQQIRSYGWKPQTIAGVHPLWMDVSGESAYFLTDHLGAPIKAIDRSSDVLWEAEYTAFGRAVVSKSRISPQLRRPGMVRDKEAEITYNHNRFYRPEWGRYLRSDPIGIEAGLNTYTYVGNEPIGRIDPDGEFGLVAMLISAAVTGLITYVTVDCMDKCEKQMEAEDPDCRRIDILDECTDRCMPFLSFLGWESPRMYPIKPVYQGVPDGEGEE